MRLHDLFHAEHQILPQIKVGVDRGSGVKRAGGSRAISDICQVTPAGGMMSHLDIGIQNRAVVRSNRIDKILLVKTIAAVPRNSLILRSSLSYATARPRCPSRRPPSQNAM
jgi:hypothetical protein